MSTLDLTGALHKMQTTFQQEDHGKMFLTATYSNRRQASKIRNAVIYYQEIQKL